MDLITAPSELVTISSNTNNRMKPAVRKLELLAILKWDCSALSLNELLLLL
jgi:hypothetical protein